MVCSIKSLFHDRIVSDQIHIKSLRIYLRQVIPDVITLGQRFRQENYHSVRVGKIFHYHNPRDIELQVMMITIPDQTVNPYGRDKVEEYKINTSNLNLMEEL